MRREDNEDPETERFVQLIEDRLNAALAEHPARARIADLVARGAAVTVRPVGDGLYEAGVDASADEWYALILDTRA